MSKPFDPYYIWLGIAPKDQPPNHYRLLGIDLFESEPKVIESAADRQMAHLRMFQTGAHSALSQQLLNEVARAKITLFDTEKKAAYDEQLTLSLDAQETEVPYPSTDACPEPGPAAFEEIFKNTASSSGRKAWKRLLAKRKAKFRRRLYMAVVGSATALLVAALLWAFFNANQAADTDRKPSPTKKTRAPAMKPAAPSTRSSGNTNRY